MTVRELRNLLSSYDDDVKVYLRIEDIVDEYGVFVNGTAEARQIMDSEEYGILDGIMICGIE